MEKSVDQGSLPQTGQIVKILRGKDQGQYAVIIRVEDSKFVWIADGDKRRFDQPKKKNVQHLQLQLAISGEVSRSLTESSRVTNAKLRHAVNIFIDSLQSDADEKGE
ncbi:KOW domain-containing RNA-binding protein [Paenibacillus lutrae]|uniref:KOW domain-containing protein n=1 Tax=Paenibacillus lutrae TaxID=2078573 RepID=A0A7X3FM15_9BACL|nr:KOW domain-containing RNA-binding protein [Paenibacillus lutrae]MVP02234.1 hypothetical protein [Paenibacillus lutrae]